jgi:dienelactone hydrolase
MRAALAVAVLLALGCRGPAVDRGETARCSHVQSERAVRGLSLCEDVWTCARPPGGPFDRVGLRRLAPCEGPPAPVVLYLPGMFMNAELPVADPRFDLRLYLAQAGVPAWGLDYRTHAVPPEASPAELARVARWDADVFMADALWAAAFVRGVDPGPLHLAGFSFGAGLAYRVASRQPAAVAGLVVLDGFAGAGRQATSAAEEGPVVDVGSSRLPWEQRKALLARVVADPDAPSPLPGFATAGDALAEILQTARSFGGDGGLANTRERVSDVVILARLLSSYDRWWPRAALDGDAPRPPGAPLPVLAFASTRIGPAWTERVRESARAFGGDAAIVRELPRHGHLDVLVERNAARTVYEPVRAWVMGEMSPG